MCLFLCDFVFQLLIHHRLLLPIKDFYSTFFMACTRSFIQCPFKHVTRSANYTLKISLRNQQPCHWGLTLRHQRLLPSVHRLLYEAQTVHRTRTIMPPAPTWKTLLCSTVHCNGILGGNKRSQWANPTHPHPDRHTHSNPHPHPRKTEMRNWWPSTGASIPLSQWCIFPLFPENL